MTIARLPVLAACLVLPLIGVATAQSGPDPAAVRRLAREAGVDALGTLPVPVPSNLDDFLVPGARARKAAIQLGKALFWDVQVGSDGQACASCHFHAGADDRTKNQLHPGADGGFDATASGGGGPNYDLTADDFPFHQLDDPQDRTSSVLHDTDDVASSQGVFAARFLGLLRGRADDQGDPVADPLFAVAGVNVRRVQARNAPSVINAAFNVTNFWDGRASDVFNGVSGRGPLDAAATILVDERKKLVPHAVHIDHASLASQAVEPPRSDREMAFRDRPFPILARKLLALRPLGRQLVHPADSVLGPLARARLKRGRLTGSAGLSVGYTDLIKGAFQKRYWGSSKKTDGYTQIERNFTLFFGLSIQLYESTLVADDAPLDRFMKGDDTALTDVQQTGLLVFVNRGPDLSTDPLFADVFAGNCVACHAGPALTTAAVSPARAPIAVAATAALAGASVVADAGTAFRDQGFANIGVRPTAEDLGRGALVDGFPLSATRRRLLALPFAPELPTCGGPTADPCPTAGRVAVDGAFKVPGLRNVALTAPYFHNGGQATLRQVIAFYERQGDFANENLHDLDPEMARVRFLEESELPLVELLVGLTDARVQNEAAPFDHPQLLVPNGHPGDAGSLACVLGVRACDALGEIPAVGQKGRPDAGLPPLEPFLGLDPMD